MFIDALADVDGLYLLGTQETTNVNIITLIKFSKLTICHHRLIEETMIYTSQTVYY